MYSEQFEPAEILISPFRESSFPPPYTKVLLDSQVRGRDPNLTDLAGDLVLIEPRSDEPFSDLGDAV